jgi:hypothetical protein
MKQSDLDRAVARATGESVALIKAMGFGELNLPMLQPARRVKAVRIPVRPIYTPALQVRSARRCA